MNTRQAGWPTHIPMSRTTGAGAWGTAPPLAKALILLATAIGLGLLIGFYAVVAGAVQRAEAGREQQRVALERQFVCSAFSSNSSRDLCLLTVSRQNPQGAVVHAVYEPANSMNRIPSRGRLTAGL